MNRRAFLKVSAASAVTAGAMAGLAPASFAENADVHTDAEVQAMVAAELKASRDVAFYPAAYKGDFEKFYVLFHKLSRAQYEKVDGAAEPGINASHYEMCVALTKARQALRQVVSDPKSTVWEIWGDQMAVETPLPTKGWEISYDNEGFRPFLNPYLLPHQGKVKGNVIIIAGGANSHRNNIVEGYPVAEYFNKQGYNAYVLQRRVNPYAAVDQQLDLARAIRYIRHNASAKNIGKTDIMIGVGFSAGGGNLMQVVSSQYGTENTPDKVYPNYVCDAVDHESADMNVVIPVYGLFLDGMDFGKNPNLPAVFGVVGQKDMLRSMILPSVAVGADIFEDFSFYMAPDAPHGVGLGTGTKGYVNGYTQIAQWPDMAVNFIESRLGLIEKTEEMDSVSFAW